MRIFITGINGFIGSHLTEYLLKNNKDWTISGIDLGNHRITHLINHPRLSFVKGDFIEQQKKVAEEIKKSDVVIPLAAIATPKTYVTDPIKVFELDFEANLTIIRQCVQLKKRLLFPSTSEVYGMCQDEFFTEEESNLVLGPINKTRWIYSCSKQLLDRIIVAYGNEGLEYTIFRPFNWIGSNQDDIHNTNGTSRVISQFIGNILRKEPIHLVNGGKQKRTFLDVSDGIKAIALLLENKELTSNQIFNIGNPTNEYSIEELAKILIKMMQLRLPDRELNDNEIIQNTSENEHYGMGYQDMEHRAPSIKKITELLDWYPSMNLEQSIEGILKFHIPEVKKLLC